MQRRPTKKSAWVTFKKNKELLLLCVPALLAFLVFAYLPMPGIYMAFTDYKYTGGIFGSEFVGFKWFEMFLANDLNRLMRNTVAYSIAGIVLGPVTGVFTALLLYELKNAHAAKAYQTIMILPYFMSWIVVSLILYIFLDPRFGAINQTLLRFGFNDIYWYSEPKYWPFILIFMGIWKGVGMGCIVYYAAMMGIDPSLYEAATIDGAGKIARIRFITLPGLIPLITIMTILSMGSVFRGDFGMFFALPRNVGMLYPTTDILDTFIFRGLQNGRLSFTTAVGVFQSFLGLIMIVITNLIVKKINPDNSLF